MNIFKTKSLKKTLQISYIFLIGIMIVPTVYSVIVTQVHTQQYNNIITNVSNANKINQIAKKDIPNELWEIVCGKKEFSSSRQNEMLDTIYFEITDMQRNSKNRKNHEKLEVAYRAYTTLRKNIEQLELQIKDGTSVTQNEASLDEIRTITALFSDIMQDFILSEIETANETNRSIKKSSIILSILQIIIVLFSFAVSLNGYVTVSNKIHKPLADMKQLSTEISHGNLLARTKVPDVEELMPLAKNMNFMAEQIDILFRKNIEEQKNFQKAEVKALQAQITPHFLYNTFDTIIWLAEQEETDKVVNITKAFSEFLRISLSRGHEWITVQQELDHIRNYLKIQKIRYNDILNYEISVSPELENFKIIKLVLQPLVENAIYHGIKNKRGRGNLKVTAEYKSDKKDAIIFTVEDDGAGFTKERLEQVNQEMNNGSEDAENLSSVYGLYNVNKKLKLYYGERTEGLKIESELGKGSKISFEIPCIDDFAE